MSVPAQHPMGIAALEVARQQGWDVRNVSEAHVAIQLGLLGYTPRDVETQFSLGPYRLDFAIPAERIDIEADGWVHGARSVRQRDAERDRRIKGWGWVVVRIDTERDDIADQLRRRVPDRRFMAGYGDALRRADHIFKAHLDRLQRHGRPEPRAALEVLIAAMRTAGREPAAGRKRT